MKKIHFAQPDNSPFRTPWCSANVRLIGTKFLETEDKDQVTCKRCQMSLGIIPDTRGNWDNRTR